MQGANIQKITRPIQAYTANIGESPLRHNNSGYLLYSQTAYLVQPLKYLLS